MHGAKANAMQIQIIKHKDPILIKFTPCCTESLPHAQGIRHTIEMVHEYSRMYKTRSERSRVKEVRH